MYSYFASGISGPKHHSSFISCFQNLPATPSRHHMIEQLRPGSTRSCWNWSSAPASPISCLVHFAYKMRQFLFFLFDFLDLPCSWSRSIPFSDSTLYAEAHIFTTFPQSSYFELGADFIFSHQKCSKYSSRSFQSFLSYSVRSRLWCLEIGFPIHFEIHFIT